METIVFFVIGFFGLTAHWYKRWVRKQCAKNFFIYMRENRRHTIASVCTMAAGVMTLAGSGLSQESLSLAFLAGYSIDSMLNK